MIDLAGTCQEPVAVLGLGRSGLAAARALKAGGASLCAWDDAAGGRERAAAEGLPLVDPDAAVWQEAATLVLSPGIPHSYPKPHPVVAKAKARGCEIIGDIDLLGRAQRDARYIGITGTNGKSTTTSLIAHILRSAGRQVEVGGNLGFPVLDLAALGSEGIYVLEMSSYQLELTHSIVFDVALLLNITPDHLDRHGGFDGYVAAKRRIFLGQERPKVAVIGADDETCRRLLGELRAAGCQEIIAISGSQVVPGGVYRQGSGLIDDTRGQTETVLDLASCPRLPGDHNAENAAAAYAACRALGVERASIAAAMADFPGLAHRQELVATQSGLSFVNDSKATNAEATARALGCYEQIYWIAGGREKDGGIASLAPYFPRLAHAFLIGEAEESFARTLEGQAPYSLCGTLEKAFADALALAQEENRPGAVILLSPAAASFDQYPDFEVRGEAFRALVQDTLTEEASDGARRVTS